jgi:hypothetical protein
MLPNLTKSPIWEGERGKEKRGRVKKLFKIRINFFSYMTPCRGLKPTDCSPVYKSGGVTIHEQFLSSFPLSPLPLFMNTWESSILRRNYAKIQAE